MGSWTPALGADAGRDGGGESVKQRHLQATAARPLMHKRLRWPHQGYGPAAERREVLTDWPGTWKIGDVEEPVRDSASCELVRVKRPEPADLWAEEAAVASRDGLWEVGCPWWLLGRRGMEGSGLEGGGGCTAS